MATISIIAVLQKYTMQTDVVVGDQLSAGWDQRGAIPGRVVLRIEP
jgi:hypothetical protein